MQHPNVILSGVAIKGDLTRLLKLQFAEHLFGDKEEIKLFSLEQHFKAASLDNNLISSSSPKRCSANYSLERLVEILLRKSLPKNDSIRRSKWSIRDLSDVIIKLRSLV